MTHRLEAALIGAYVADAAALGLHWLYDAERVAVVAGDAPAFITPDAALFDGFKGVFVHPGKRAGDPSQYGAHLRVAVQSILRRGGRFERDDFQDHFAATFGAGGAWVGYMDKATKGTLANLAADRRDPSGADDDQVPALAKLPAVLAQASVTDAEVAAAVAITNANETAAHWAAPVAAMLRAAYGGASAHGALDGAIAAAEAERAAALRGAIETDEADTVAYAGEVGRACPLPQSMPVIAHILARATSYREAVERNILAGGDNCGRAIVRGAIFGAAHGLGGDGVPLSWIARLSDVQELCAEIDGLCAAGPS